MTPTPPADLYAELREAAEKADPNSFLIVYRETILAFLADWKRLHDGFLKGDALMVEADEAIAKAEAALRESEERAGKLREALEPFSRVSEALDDPSWSDVDELHLRSEDDFLLAKLPFGSFRRARATLTNEATDV